MRHSRIQKSKRHKKLKNINEISDYNFLSDKSIEKLKEQQMPRKLRDLIASKDGSRKVTLNNETMANESINRSKKKKKKKANTIIVKSNHSSQMEPGMTKPTKSVPEVMEKRTTESDGHFLNRINFMVAKAMAEAKLEEHFDVDLQEQKLKKQQQPKQHPKNTLAKEATALLDDKQIERLKAKQEKRKKKDLAKKAKKLLKQRRLVKKIEADEIGGKLNRKDQILFGERVHAPPTLVLPRRVAKLT